MNTWIIIGVFYAVTGFIALFWYTKYQLKNNEYEKILRKGKITLKERMILMEISEEIENYKKGENAFTALRNITDLIFTLKKEDTSTIKQENTNI